MKVLKAAECDSSPNTRLKPRECHTCIFSKLSLFKAGHYDTTISLRDLAHPFRPCAYCYCIPYWIIISGVLGYCIAALCNLILHTVVYHLTTTVLSYLGSMIRKIGHFDLKYMYVASLHSRMMVQFITCIVQDGKAIGLVCYEWFVCSV